MLHLRLRVDVQCPRHPRRTYHAPPAGCVICQSIAAAADRAREVERELRGASRLGAALHWKNHRRRATSPPLP